MALWDKGAAWAWSMVTQVCPTDMTPHSLRSRCVPFKIVGDSRKPPHVCPTNSPMSPDNKSERADYSPLTEVSLPR